MKSTSNKDKNPSREEPLHIDQLLRLAVAPPDELLLRRYLETMAKNYPGEQGGSCLLSDEELRWVETNLAHNPLWERYRSGLPSERQKAVREHCGRGRRALARRLSPLDHKPIRSLPVLRPVVCVLLVYVVLWLGGRFARDPVYELAAIGEYGRVLERPVRGEDSSPGHEAFSQGATALQASSRTTFGLFAGYDLARVEQAERSLRTAYQIYSDPFQRAEVAFFLAKAALMQGDERKARRWLETVLTYEVSDYRQRAEELLGELQ